MITKQIDNTPLNVQDYDIDDITSFECMYTRVDNTLHDDDMHARYVYGDVLYYLTFDELTLYVDVL